MSRGRARNGWLPVWHGLASGPVFWASGRGRLLQVVAFGPRVGMKRS